MSLEFERKNKIYYRRKREYFKGANKQEKTA